MPNRSQQIPILPGLAAVTALGGIAVATQPATAASLIPVDTELSLLIDVSLSISSTEYDLQLEGYQTAFTNLAPQFGGNDFGNVAVNVVQWAGSNLQEESIAWTFLNNETSALQFAETIAALTRPFRLGTSPGPAIEFATPLFSTNEYDGQRWVIDVSGDGRGNTLLTSTARDNALAAGVDAINGLPILPISGSAAGVDDWYRNNIQGGEGAFTIAATGFEDIGRALEEKLVAELTLPPSDPEAPIVAPELPVSESDLSISVPEPVTLWGLGAVLGGLLYRRRRHLA
ncbi:MAG: DUF1194 domain-containing protein [Cyanobacteria bacterium P01_F01_bin.56]